MSGVQLLKVSTRMLLDLIKMLEAGEKEFELGCKCKDETTASGLLRQLSHMIRDYPVETKIKEDGVTVVVVSNEPKTTLNSQEIKTPG